MTCEDFTLQRHTGIELSEAFERLVKGEVRVFGTQSVIFRRLESTGRDIYMVCHDMSKVLAEYSRCQAQMPRGLIFISARACADAYIQALRKCISYAKLPD